MDTYAFFERLNAATRNIKGLSKTTTIYKYDGHMPCTHHYDQIYAEISGKNKSLSAALSKKIIQQKTEIIEIDKAIEIILKEGVDNS